MRLIIILLLTALSLPLTVTGRHFQVTLSEPGTLAGILGGRKYFTDSLTVSGEINDSDIRFLWESTFYGQTTHINLANARLADKRLPDNAFFHPSEQAFIQFAPDDLRTQYIKLKELILPDDIEEIGFGAFAFSPNLKNLNIPHATKKIDERAFLSGGIEGRLYFWDALEEIGDYAFDNSWGTKYVDLPGSLKTVGKAAFRRSLIEHLKLYRFSPDYVGYEAFANNYFKSLELYEHNNIENWGECVFSGCPFLEEVNIGEGITSIPSGCFYGSSIERITFPSTLKHISEDAFYYNTFVELELNEGLETLGDRAFHSNQRLKIVTLPSSLKEMGWGCFGGQSLKFVVVKTATPPVCDPNSFSVVYENVTIIVPKGSTEAYRKATCWNKFTKYAELDDFSNIDEAIAKACSRPATIDLTREGISITGNSDSSQEMPYSVFTIDGRNIADGLVGECPVSLSLNPGTYIVKIGSFSEKVAVR